MGLKDILHKHSNLEKEKWVRKGLLSSVFCTIAVLWNKFANEKEINLASWCLVPPRAVFLAHVIMTYLCIAEAQGTILRRQRNQVPPHLAEWSCEG